MGVGGPDLLVSLGHLEAVLLIQRVHRRRRVGNLVAGAG
jgi:hypothetical protein